MAKIHTIESARELALKNASTSARRGRVQRAAESPRCSDKAAHCVRCDDLVDDLELDESGLCPACVVDVLRCRLTANGLAASDGFRERLQSSRAKPRGQRRGIQERS